MISKLLYKYIAARKFNMTLRKIATQWWKGHY